VIGYDEYQLCANCIGKRANCQYPKLARPGADALGSDVFATIRKYGYFIKVLDNYTKLINRFAFLLLEYCLKGLS